MGQPQSAEDYEGDCTYCGQKSAEMVEYYPHEEGGYCIFAPRNEIEYACNKCANKKCESCNVERPRYYFIDCEKCGKTHCYNNTDMKYEGTPLEKSVKLCDLYKGCGG